MNEYQYLWDHFKFNAEQRLKGFNFFVLLSIFANGGVFTAIEKQLAPGLLVLLGGFVLLLSAVFWLVDARSQQLLLLTIPGMKKLEEQLPEHSRLFVLDAQKQGVVVRYTFAFRALLVAQCLFGIGVAVYGTHTWLC